MATQHDSAIVITGVGPVTPIGIGLAEVTKALASGRSAVAEVTGFDVEARRCKVAVEIIDFDVKKFLTSEKGYLDRNSALAFAAARLALEDANLSLSPDMTPKIGLCMGTCFGNMETARAFYLRMLEKGPRLAPPFIFPHTYNNTTASLLAIEHGLKGVHANFSSGAAAGAEAIAYAVLNLRAGRADVMVAGGVEAISPAAFTALDDAGRLKTAPGQPGFVLGEGACMLVLEAESAARRRGARIRAHIAGVGLARDPAPAVKNALSDAGMSAGDIGLILPAANGSPDDAAESRALADLFGPQDGRMWNVKSLWGETVGASGPLAVAAATAQLRPDRRWALVNAIEPGCLAVSFVVGLECAQP